MELKKNKTRIIFLLSPGANLYDFSGIAQVFYEAIDHGLEGEIHYCSLVKQIKSSPGLEINNLTPFNRIKLVKGDILFIMSANISYMLSPDSKPPERLTRWIVNGYETGAKICAICNGAFLLAKTGLLNGRKCTTHWKRTGDLKKRFPAVDVVENILFIEDSDILTSAGSTSGVDVALYLLNKLKDDYFTYKISRELVIYNRRSGQHEQKSVYLNYRNHVHQGIHLVQDWLQSNLQRPINLYDLSKRANMSERNFTRVFKRETGITVNDYITRLRQEKIKEMMRDPGVSRQQMAHACGLMSERHVSRLMKLN